MKDEYIVKLWERLSSASSIENLDYDEAVTIGSVFGEMKAEIIRLREIVEFYAKEETHNKIVEMYDGLTGEKNNTVKLTMIQIDKGKKARIGLREE